MGNRVRVALAAPHQGDRAKLPLGPAHPRTSLGATTFLYGHGEHLPFPTTA